MKLNIFQIERLCTVVYLDALIEQNKHNLADIMTYLLEEGFEKEAELPVLMTREEWETVAQSIIDDTALGKLKIADFTDKNRAFCFVSESVRGEAYVVFRGTSGDDEWLDNGLGMVWAETPAQKAALDFVIRAKTLPNVNFICVAGHSKGGNKAQYCAVAGAGIVDRCVSVDGQGFSRLFFDKYNGIIEESRSKMTSIAERRDFVNCLGFYLKAPEYYSGGRGAKNEEFPHGNPLPYFHCPDALRLKTGEFGEAAPVSYISKAVNTFVVYFLSDKEYAKKREKTAIGLVSLMTKDGGGKKGAEAVAEAALAFFELASESEAFRTELRDLLLNEKDLIAATTHMVKQNHRNSGKIADTAMKRTAEKLLAKPAYFRYFIKNSERFVMFMRKTQKAKEHAEHIHHFIKGIFRHIEKIKHQV